MCVLDAGRMLLQFLGDDLSLSRCSETKQTTRTLRCTFQSIRHRGRAGSISTLLWFGFATKNLAPWLVGKLLRYYEDLLLPRTNLVLFEYYSTLYTAKTPAPRPQISFIELVMVLMI